MRALPAGGAASSLRNASMSELLREFRLPLRGRKKEINIEVKTGSEEEGGGNRGRESKLAR